MRNTKTIFLNVKGSKGAMNTKLFQSKKEAFYA